MPIFIAYLTNTGLAKLATANAGGAPVALTEMAVGDGNGNPVTPDATMTGLVHEVYRAPINVLAVSTTDPTMMLAELLIPSDEGGFAVRELGVFDAEGDLFAVSNFPDTYKPLGTEGSVREMVLRMAVKVSNSANITLVIDSSIVGATRQWVLNTITPAFLLPGGTVTQVLSKASNADGDFVWIDPTAAVDVAVDVIKEIQTATASQQTFTLATMTTENVAVYVDGSREYDFTVLNATQIQLSRTLPSGIRVGFFQNEPNEPLQLRRTITGRGYFLGQLA